MRYSKGTLFALTAVLAYTGFEAYAIYQVRDKTKPDYIHDVLIQAKTITEACQSERLVFRERFEKTLTRVEGNLRNMLLESVEDATSESVQQQLLAKTKRSVEAANNELAASNCDEQSMKNHFQRYRLYAKKSR